TEQHALELPSGARLILWELASLTESAQSTFFRQEVTSNCETVWYLMGATVWETVGRISMQKRSDANQDTYSRSCSVVEGSCSRFCTWRLSHVSTHYERAPSRCGFWVDGTKSAT